MRDVLRHEVAGGDTCHTSATTDDPVSHRTHAPHRGAPTDQMDATISQVAPERPRCFHVLGARTRI
jgi:hypothetical protein